MIKPKHLVLLLAYLLLFTVANAQSLPYKLKEGSIYIHVQHTIAGVSLLRLTPVTANIIRVTSTQDSLINDEVSLMAIDHHKSDVKYTAEYTGGNVILKTDSVKAVIAVNTGLIEFYDSHGKLLVKQSQVINPAFVKAYYNGESTYKISQYFDAQPNEAYYGLGQHQQGFVNYRGRHIDLAQNNTEVAVPFFISNKNYGILWDNNSITAAGDVRDLLPLNALKLYSKNAESGWLDVSYSLKNNPAKEVFKQVASEIDYNWLSDVKKFPDSVKMADAIVTYEGAVEGAETGLYQLQVKYAGYVKGWLDDKQLIDYWRQPWNPATTVVDLNLQKQKKYKFKIQWIPGGTESYLALSVLPPAPEIIKNTFALTSEAGNAIDYYLLHGHNADSIISGYRTITGKAVMLPKWSMGFWQSRERYKTQDEILNTVKEFRDRKIPLDNIVLDWSYWKQDQWGSQEFDPARFSDPKGMIDQLHNKHVNFMISVWPKFYEGTEAYNNFNKNNFLFKRNIVNRQRDWIAQGYVSTFYDAFNPNARKAFWALINKKIYSKGVDAWWLDATEPDILSNASIAERKLLMTPTYLGSSTKYFNAFPLQNASGVYEGQRNANPDKRVFILTRSAYAGLQRYAAATWSGDIASRWEDMKSQIGAGINFSLSGMPYWTMDIGGFAVEPRYEKLNGPDLDEWRELTTRWYQFGAFVPLFRVHGQFPFREIYNIAPPGHPAYQSMLYYNKLRYRLMPYIYSLAGKAYHHDYTIMRGLMMDFAGDKKVEAINDQYMFGPSLLINPVYTYEAHNRKVYLPKSAGWFDLYSGKYFEGGNNIQADAPYNRMPVFVKAGSIIPFGPQIQYTDEKPADVITLYVYTGANAHFTLYEDEGTNYNYEKGKYSEIKFSYNENTHLLSIGNRYGSYSTMLLKRNFHIITITQQKSKKLDFEQKADRVISYVGNAVEIKL